MTRNKYFKVPCAAILAVIGVAACSGTPVSLGNGRDGVDPLAPTSNTEETCLYAGKEYDVGDSFPASDGCNTCGCGEDGSVGCTKKACVDPSEASCNYGGSAFADGATFDALDGCNTCACEAGSVSCTEKACELGTGGCDFKGVHFENGEKVPSNDCNTAQCLNGAIATTMKVCESGAGCNYNGQEYGLGAAIPPAKDDGCTKCSCESSGVICSTVVGCSPVDVCSAAEEMCVAGGGDPASCKMTYVDCAAQVPPTSCDETFKRCMETLPEDGDPGQCKTPYEKCLGSQVPPANMCAAALTACEEKLSTGDDYSQCKDAYTKCTGSGGSSEPLPANPSLCDSSFNQCAEVWSMSGGDVAQCKDTYIACADHAAGIKPPDLELCVAERDACEADNLNGCELYFDDCVQRVGQQAMCESAFGICLSDSPELAEAVVCKNQYAKCAPFGLRLQRPTREQCASNREGCESKGEMPICVVNQEACLDLVLPTEKGSCEVDGVEYRNGDRLPEVDCNVERCIDGEVHTTVIACEE